MSPGPAADVGARRASCPPEVAQVYSRLMRSRPLDSNLLYDAVFEGWCAGARAEAECRREGRAAAALEVAELVDGFGQHAERAGEDHAHFAGLAAEVYFAGTPLRRRLRLVWRLLRPRWVGELAWRRSQRRREGRR